MKKLLFTLFMAGNLVTFGQTVNGVEVSNIDTEYAQIIGTSKFLSTKVRIQLNFGQRDKALVSKDTQVLDENGKQVEFNSMVDALNFMSSIGYEYIDAYVVTVGQQNVYHYLLKKKSQEK